MFADKVMVFFIMHATGACAKFNLVFTGGVKYIYSPYSMLMRVFMTFVSHALRKKKKEKKS